MSAKNLANLHDCDNNNNIICRLHCRERFPKFAHASKKKYQNQNQNQNRDHINIVPCKLLKLRIRLYYIFHSLSRFCYCSSSSRGLQLFTRFDAINALESRRRARVASRCRLRRGAGQGRACDYAMIHPKKVVCACVGVCVYMPVCVLKNFT